MSPSRHFSSQNVVKVNAKSALKNPENTSHSLWLLNAKLCKWNWSKCSKHTNQKFGQFPTKISSRINYLSFPRIRLNNVATAGHYLLVAVLFWGSVLAGDKTPAFCSEVTCDENGAFLRTNHLAFFCGFQNDLMLTFYICLKDLKVTDRESLSVIASPPAGPSPF